MLEQLAPEEESRAELKMSHEVEDAINEIDDPEAKEAVIEFKERLLDYVSYLKENPHLTELEINEAKKPVAEAQTKVARFFKGEDPQGQSKKIAGAMLAISNAERLMH